MSGQVDGTGQRSRETRGLLLGFIAVVIFGATVPMTRLALGDLGPFFLTFGRAAVAGLIALAVLTLGRRRWPSRPQARRLGVAALLLVIGFPLFTGLALRSVPANHGGVVLGIIPLSTSVAAALLQGARPSWGFWLCGVLGAALVAGFALRQGGGQIGGGDVLLLLAIGCTAIGYTISSELSQTMPGWEVISWCVVFMLPVTLPLALVFAPDHAGAVALSSWLAFAYLGVMSMYVGFFAWNAGLAMGGTARVSQVQLLQSSVTLILSALINREVVSFETIGFAMMVLVVVFAGRWFRAR